MDPTASKMTGGELPPDEKGEFLKLRRLIEACEDVHQVLAMEPAKLGGPGYYYMVETPFSTFPRFVIGITDASNAVTEVLFQSGAKWSAEDAWEVVTRGGRP